MRRLMIAAAMTACLVIGPARADDEQTMRAAATVLALAMQTDGDLVIDSPDHARLDGTSITFKKDSPCTYSEHEPSLSGDRYIILNFNKLTGHYGYIQGEIAFGAADGRERQASCWRFDSQGTRCSGSLHVARPTDENLLVRSLWSVINSGCDEGARQLR